jgi:hypothetical protein
MNKRYKVETSKGVFYYLWDSSGGYFRLSDSLRDDTSTNEIMDEFDFTRDEFTMEELISGMRNGRLIGHLKRFTEDILSTKDYTDVDLFFIDNAESISFYLDMKHDDFIIENSNGDTHLIKGLMSRILFNYIFSTDSIQMNWMKGMRSYLTDHEIASGYAHSHLSGIPKSFLNYCLGDTVMANEVNRRHSKASTLDLSYVITLAETFVRWESLEGGPHRRIRDYVLGKWGSFKTRLNNANVTTSYEVDEKNSSYSVSGVNERLDLRIASKLENSAIDSLTFPCNINNNLSIGAYGYCTKNYFSFKFKWENINVEISDDDEVYRLIVKNIMRRNPDLFRKDLRIREKLLLFNNITELYINGKHEYGECHFNEGSDTTKEAVPSDAHTEEREVDLPF